MQCELRTKAEDTRHIPIIVIPQEKLPVHGEPSPVDILKKAHVGGGIFICSAPSGDIHPQTRIPDLLCSSLMRSSGNGVVLPIFSGRNE